MIHLPFYLKDKVLNNSPQWKNMKPFLGMKRKARDGLQKQYHESEINGRQWFSWA